MTFMEKSALELLIKCGVYRFPVDAAAIAQDLNYNLVDYEKGMALIASAGLESMCIYDGFSAKIGEKCYIFLKKDLCKEKRNWIIAHEIAHIRHHLVSEGLIGHSINQEENQLLEQEAEVFAKSLLAPLYALANMKIVEPADIEQITGLASDKAREVFFDLSEYEARQKELLLQSRIRKQFRLNRRRIHISWLTILLLLCICMLSICILLLVQKRPSDPAADGSDEPAAVNVSLIPADTQSGSVSEAAFDGTCFWTAGGEVYHLYHDCQALKIVTDSFCSGSLESAQNAKSRLCRFCERRLRQQTEPSSEETQSGS